VTAVRSHAYLRLPIQPDEGFPQSFRLSLGPSTYTVSLYVNITDDDLTDVDRPLDLPTRGAFMVMSIRRDSPGPPTTVFLRKLVTEHEYEAAELALLFTRIAVHPRNLNGAGPFGSEVTGGVALRWGS
jgi:hypothetical protein